MGANGQLGFQLRKTFSKWPTVQFYDKNSLDITDEKLLNTVLRDKSPDIIVNAAAYTAVDRAEEQQDLSNRINHLAPLSIAKAAEYIGAVFIHISTDYVFDGENEEPYVESDKTSPKSVYGQTKLDGESAVIKHCKKHIIIRTSWVFGEHGGNFVKTILRLASTKPSFSVVDDQFGGPTYAGDIANAIASICSQVTHDEFMSWGVYHFGGSPYVSWFDFSSQIVKNALNSDLLQAPPNINPIKTIDYPTPAKRPHFSKLNCQKIKSIFGIEMSDWKEALKSITNYR